VPKCNLMHIMSSQVGLSEGPLIRKGPDPMRLAHFQRVTVTSVTFRKGRLDPKINLRIWTSIYLPQDP